MIERDNPLSEATKDRARWKKNVRSQEVETRSYHEEAVNHDRTGKPVVGRDASHEPGNEQSMLNEVNIDFRILGLPVQKALRCPRPESFALSSY